MNIVNNEFLRKMIKSVYTLQDIHDIRALLSEKGALHFHSLDNGLFSASMSSDAENTGYRHVWVRDNVYVAYAHYISGQAKVTTKNLITLMDYFIKYRVRFEKIIDNDIPPIIAMERPNIRFNGDDITEDKIQWEHAQNDALGYFLWLYCKLCTDVKTKIDINLQPEEIEMLTLFPLYFQAIHFWEDEDSGHWEENRKIEASSIGVVVAGLIALKDLFLERSFLLNNCQYKNKVVNVKLLDELIERGLSALKKILPLECIQSHPNERRYDGALLFLIFPLDIVKGDIAEQILANVIKYLQGDYGIRRYLGDSFWCKDFQELPKKIQTSIYTERQKWLKQHGRDVVVGEEAQWCIFDPIISAIFGRRFQSSERKDDDLVQQIKYLNRSLGQVTGKGNSVKNVETGKFIEIGEFRCPELFYIKEGYFSPNVSTPLLWTQANLIIALVMMERSLMQLDLRNSSNVRFATISKQDEIQ